ncbi:MAG: exodeoxyribonuclease VII small subunit [Christensenellales bacterium]
MDNFEQELLRLSDIAQRLQSGQEGIEKSMELYARGIRLADALQKKLDEYKTKIEIIKTGEHADE